MTREEVEELRLWRGDGEPHPVYEKLKAHTLALHDKLDKVRTHITNRIENESLTSLERNQLEDRLAEMERQMAMADYYLCDVCGRKTFYDANLGYYEEPGDYYNEHPKTGKRLPDGDVGDMKVICRDCAKTHTVEIGETDEQRGFSS